MTLTKAWWSRYRGRFTEDEKHELREAIRHQLMVPPGWLLHESKLSLATRAKIESLRQQVRQPRKGPEAA